MATFILVCLWGRPTTSTGQVQIPLLSGVRVDARVTSNATTGINTFEYRLVNGSSNLRIDSFNVDIRSSQDREVLSAEGLSFVAPFAAASTELTLSRLGVGNYVPVGVTSQPAGWSGAVQPPGDLSWGISKEFALGRPGETVAPFAAISRGLPGIRDGAVEPDVFALQPNIDQEGVEIDRVSAAVEAAIQRVRTVGPVAPPKNLDVVAFADYIASLRSEAGTLGWVRAGANVSSIDSLLSQVRAQLASGAFGSARTSASAFIEAVDAASCTDFNCASDRPLTAEARALLGLNMAFLRDHIPSPPTLQTSPANIWLGLKNSDNQGAQFDVRAALYANDVLIAEGVTRCVTGITRNAAQARNVAVAFGDSTGAVGAGGTLRLELSTRIGTNLDGTKCPGHNNAVGLRLYYDAATRASVFGAAIGGGGPSSYFLHSSGSTFTLDQTSPTGSSAKQKDSAAVNFNGGNPWAVIGSWSLAAP